jgi:phage terminase large subunit
MIKPDVPDCFKYLNQPMRYKGAYGGRGSAKSWSVAAILLQLGTMSPLRVLCGREFQKSINDSVKSLLDDTIRRHGLFNFYESQKTQILGRNGSRFFFHGLARDPDGIRSFEKINIFWGEEANTISQHSLDIIKPTIRIKGSELWFTYNRKLKDEPVHELAKRDNAAFRLINYDQNPYFSQTELVDEMEYDKLHNYEKYRHVWLGEPQQFSEAAVFRGKYRVEDFDTPADAEFYFGADWGFSVDPTSLIRCFIDGRKLYIDHETYGVGVEIDDTPEMFDNVPESRKWEIIADSARPETISYMIRKGFRMKGAIKGKDSVVEGVKFLQDYEIICHTRCSHMAYELGAYSYKVDKLTQEVIPVLEDKDNHCIDSLRYAVESVRRKTSFMIS